MFSRVATMRHAFAGLARQSIARRHIHASASIASANNNHNNNDNNSDRSKRSSPLFSMAALASTVTTVLVAHQLNKASASPRELEEQPKQLTPAEIEQRVGALSTITRVVAASPGGRVAAFHTAQYAANPVCEDTMRVETNVGAAGDAALFGMFDGHSGRGASHFCRDELFDYLHHSLANGDADELLSGHAFENADRHFLNLCWYAARRDKTNDGLSGACATVSHVDGARGRVTTANAGDCRAIIGRFDAGAKQGYTAVELTIDHQIDTNPAERERLVSTSFCACLLCFVSSFCFAAFYSLSTKMATRRS
jgi:hypothetical protein